MATLGDDDVRAMQIAAQRDQMVSFGSVILFPTLIYHDIGNWVKRPLRGFIVSLPIPCVEAIPGTVIPARQSSRELAIPASAILPRLGLLPAPSPTSFSLIQFIPARPFTIFPHPPVRRDRAWPEIHHPWISPPAGESRQRAAGNGGKARGGKQLGLKKRPAALAPSPRPGASPHIPPPSVAGNRSPPAPNPSGGAATASPAAPPSTMQPRPAQGGGWGAIPPNFGFYHGDQQGPSSWVFPPGGM
ncbi:uncharacterized protein LOC110435848 [Sorghum bicolor]|uniref:uncharacterized protein LOC110435848 n=1 Tax=Sorghum bicolor TaxID=4558 RepID=UPI000B423E32|nr:uncharacterized protein LOC110435848 [Sorghum bicolor]|eukprot:XP_021317598.1 uncharacterized protein LOC110435848 [Sorghum bicolor]